jgi:hypothetical protein
MNIYVILRGMNKMVEIIDPHNHLVSHLNGKFSTILADPPYAK